MQDKGASEVVFFFSYRYWTSWHGVHALPDQAVLVPTAEEVGVYRLAIFASLFIFFSRSRAMACWASNFAL